MSCIFNQECIVLDAKLKDKNEAINLAGKLLVDVGCTEEKYTEYMFKRDEECSVYIGNGVAIPHGLLDSMKHIKKSGLSFIQVPNGVDFDGNIAYLIIGIAGIENEHMELLSKIALACCEMENVEKMRKATSKEEILRLLDMQ